MCVQNSELEYEDRSISSFLGLYVDNNGIGNDNTIKFTMDRHIVCLLDLKVINDCTPNYIMGIQIPLGPDIGGTTHKETDKRIHVSAVGMLQYLSRN